MKVVVYALSSFVIVKFKLYAKAKPKKKENAFSALLKEVNKNKLCESMDMSQVKFKPYSVLWIRIINIFFPEIFSIYCTDQNIENYDTYDTDTV